MQGNHKKIRRISLKLSQKTIYQEATKLLCSKSVRTRRIDYRPPFCRYCRAPWRPNLADCVFPRNDGNIRVLVFGAVGSTNRHQWHRYLSCFNLICVLNDGHVCAIWRSLDQRWHTFASRSSKQSSSTSRKSILVDCR